MRTTACGFDAGWCAFVRIDRTVIVRHVNNIYKSSNWAGRNMLRNYMFSMNSNGKCDVIPFYNLDMILSVGYRVNSKMPSISYLGKWS